MYTYYRTIRFQDTDAAGVVYFANVLSMCHEAYEASIGSVGINLKVFFSNSTVAFPIVHANVTFFQPLFCGDRLTIVVTPQKLDDSKFEVNYEVTIADRVAAKAVTRHVCIDTSSRAKRDLTEEIHQWLESPHSPNPPPGVETPGYPQSPNPPIPHSSTHPLSSAIADG